MEGMKASVVISRPLEEVFEFVTNPENDPRWQSAILESRRTSEGPLGVGTTEAGVGKVIGRRVEWTSEVTEYEPNRKVKYRVTGGPLSADQTVTFEPAEGGTKFTLVYDVKISGFFKLLSSMIVSSMRKQLKLDLINLKDILEVQT